MIVPTEASKGLGRRLAIELRERLVEPIRKVFADGELYVRIPESDERIIVVGSTHQPDRHWMELLLLADAAERMGSEVIAVIPYYGYGRQDKVFLPGEPLSAEVFARALPTDTILTVEPHFIRREGETKRWGKRVVAVGGHEPLAKAIGEVDVVVAPDEGAKDLAERVGRVVGADVVVFRKERDKETGKIGIEGEEVEGERVAVVDDIIASGGTMLRAAEYIVAKELVFGGVHGVFAPGWERLKKLGHVVVTDTIEREESVVSVAGVLAQWISSL